jgi:uncharacterized membrane protein
MFERRYTPALIALVAMLIAITTVFTYIPPLPIGPGGYLNFSDIAVVFNGLTFGPVIGAITGGIGTAIADLLLGYGQWAPFSLLAHGLEGLIIGLVAWRSRSLPLLVLAWLLGSVAMVGVYFLADWLVITNLQTALADAPANGLQAAAGIFGIPLMLLVRQAYPPIDRIGRPRTWQEK